MLPPAPSVPPVQKGVFINSLQAGSAVDSEEAELQPLNDTQIVLVWLCATTIRCPSEALSKLC